MQAFLIRRLLLLVFVLFGISVITFSISHIVPADPARLAAGPRAGPEQVETIRKKMGLDKPLYMQYLSYVGGLAHGDLGYSIYSRRPVLEDFADYFPATIELAITAMIFVIVLGIPLGVISAVKANRWPDKISQFFCVSGVAMPVFWSGMIFQLLFFKWLGWLPAGGRIGVALSAPNSITGLYILDSLLRGDWEVFFNGLHHVILPAFTLSLPSLSLVARMVRSTMLDVMSLDYVRTARSKGLAERSVIIKHALRNALIPTTTVLGLQMGMILGGDFLVEIIFNWPGIGLYALNTIMAMDYMAIMSVTLLIAVSYMVANLVVDIIYTILDPRIKYS